MNGFDGFPSTMLEFLRGLRADNSKAWFDAHRAQYEADYIEPAKRFVVAAGEALAAFVPEIQAEPRVNGSIFRINRDIRFSADKTPYKDHLDMWFWEGERRGAVSGFFLRITPETIGVGAGCHGFSAARLKAFREAVADAETGPRLARIAALIESAGETLSGAGYRRMPAGYAVSPEAERFLLHKALFVHIEEPADARLGDGRILEACVEHWRRLAPLHRWLVDYVQGV